jgi:predicted Zn-dependent protease
MSKVVHRHLSATLPLPMRDLSDRSLDTAVHLGASYADVRVVHRRDESIAVKSGRVEGVAAGESEGFGVRVLVDGAWGFASSSRLAAGEADRVAAESVRIARASATALRDRVQLDDRKEKVNLKIREAQLQKLPYMLVVGDREAESGMVSVRHRKHADLGAKSLDAFIADLRQLVDSKACTE